LEPEQKLQRKSGFVNGVAIGFGIGCFASFIALIIAASHHAQLTGQSFEIALSNFSFPISYFFVLGALFLIVGLIWERFEKHIKTSENIT